MASLRPVVIHVFFPYSSRLYRPGRYIDNCRADYLDQISKSAGRSDDCGVGGLRDGSDSGAGVEHRADGGHAGNGRDSNFWAKTAQALNR